MSKATAVQELVGSAMRKAYNYGQTYWQQADSEYVSQHKKADATAARFSQLVDETLGALADPADRIAALEAKCALLSASLKQADAVCDELTAIVAALGPAGSAA